MSEDGGGKWYIGRLRRNMGQNPMAIVFGVEAIVFCRNREGRVDVISKDVSGKWLAGTASKATASAHVQLETDPFTTKAVSLRSEGDGQSDPYPTQQEACAIWRKVSQ